jgi:hypothetical protein
MMQSWGSWIGAMACHDGNWVGAKSGFFVGVLYQLPLKGILEGICVHVDAHTATEETLFLSSRPGNYYTKRFPALKTHLHFPTMQQTIALMT